MRDYIFEKVKDTTRYIKFGNTPVSQRDDLPDNIDIQSVFRSIEDIIPSKFFRGLNAIEIGHQEIFDKRDANAVYKDGVFYITHKQDNATDLIDDVIHEFAHHVEMLYPEEIYGDEKIKKEFTFIVACNTRHVGKGMMMAPNAKIDDGLLDLIIVNGNISRFKLFQTLPKLFKGTHIHDPEVEYLQVKEFTIDTDGNDNLNIDGELKGSTPIDVKIIPQAVEIFN